MKLTVLVDNNTLIDRYYLGEPGFSIYIEDGDRRILFDTGYSDVVVTNAEKMGIDLNQIDTIVLSHGHNDHTGGLRYLSSLKQEIRVIAHPDIFNERSYEGLDVSSPVKQLPDYFRMILTDKPFRITDRLLFLGQIERSVSPLRCLEDDPLYDDTALVYERDDDIFIITACSHSGIDNIVDQAIRLTGKDHIAGIIGGFHLLEDESQALAMAMYLGNKNIDVIYPCHCTDLQAKIILSRYCCIKEAGVSTVIEI